MDRKCLNFLIGGWGEKSVRGAWAVAQKVGCLFNTHKTLGHLNTWEIEPGESGDPELYSSFEQNKTTINPQPTKQKINKQAYNNKEV